MTPDPGVTYDAARSRGRAIFEPYLGELRDRIAELVTLLVPDDRGSASEFTDAYRELVWGWREGLMVATEAEGFKRPRYGGDLFEYAICMLLEESLRDLTTAGQIEIRHNARSIPNYHWRKGKGRLSTPDVTVYLRGHELAVDTLPTQVINEFEKHIRERRPVGHPRLAVEVKTNIESKFAIEWMSDFENLSAMGLESYLVFHNKWVPEIESLLERRVWFVKEYPVKSWTPRADSSDLGGLLTACRRIVT